MGKHSKLPSFDELPDDQAKSSAEDAQVQLIERMQGGKNPTAEDYARATARAVGVDEEEVVESMPGGKNYDHWRSEELAMQENKKHDELEMDLLNRFTYHPPQNDDQIIAYQNIRHMGLDFARFIHQYVPECRELSLAVTKIEEAVMWANAGIARHSDE